MSAFGRTAWMRGRAERLMPETAIAILRNTPADDGQGGETEDWDTASTVVGRIIEKATAEREEGGKIVSATDGYALLPHDADVVPTDRLRRGSTVFEIVGTNAGESDRTELRLELRRRV
jgi:head-tail adaptor